MSKLRFALAALSLAILASPGSAHADPTCPNNGYVNGDWCYFNGKMCDNRNGCEYECNRDPEPKCYDPQIVI